MTPDEAFRLVITEVGSASKLAQLLNVTQSHISDIKVGRRRVPARLIKKVVALSNGKVKAEELRPDLY